MAPEPWLKDQAATSPTGAWLETVTLTFDAVRVFPLASRALAESACEPSTEALVFHGIE